MKYFVYYNGTFVAMYQSIKPAMNLIKRKGWKNDVYDNIVYIMDGEGNPYNPATGEPDDSMLE